jgi:hypothetical protein
MAVITNTIRWASNTEELKKNLREGLNQIEVTRAGAEKLAQTLGGDRLIMAAHRYAAAVQEIGGVARLTEAEQARVNAVVTKAIEKYQLFGKEAPAALRELAAATKAAGQDTNAAQAYVLKLAEQVGAMAGGFISVKAVIGAFQETFRVVVGYVQDSVKAYGEAEAAQNKLVTALRRQSTATPDTIRAYNDLASQFQRTTVYSDDLVNEMEALLVQVGGIMPSKMRDALQASTDLASGLGIDLQQATMLVAKAAAGHTETLGRYGITVSEAALKTRGFDAVLEAVNRQFGGQAAAQLETYAGKLQQAANLWNNIQEAVGKFLLDNPLVARALTDLGNALKKGDEASSGGLPDLISELAQHIPVLDAGTQSLLRTWALLSHTEDWMSAAVDTIPVIDGYTKIWVKSLLAAADAESQIDAMQRRIFAIPSPFEQLTKSNALPPITAGLALFDKELKEHEEALKRAKAAAEAHAHALAALREQLSGSKAREELTNLRTVWQSLTPVQRENIQVIERLLAAYEPLRKNFAPGALPHDFENLRATHGKLREEIEKLEGAAFGLHNIEGFGRPLPPEVAASWGKIAEKVHEIEFGKFGAPDIGKVGGLKVDPKDLLKLPSPTAMQRAYADFPRILEQAFTGGGGVRGAIGAFGTRIGEGLFAKDGPFAKGATAATGMLSSVFGKTIGGALGAALPGIGSLIGPGLQLAFSGIKKLFGGPSQAELQGRDTVKAFEQQLAGMLTTTQKAEAGGRQWAMTTIAVRDAFLGAGRSAADAEQIVKQLWNTKDPEAYKKAIEDIQGALAFQDQAAKTLDETVKKYGFTLSELGPALQRGQLDKQAQTLYQDFKVLTAGGIDVDTVIGKMKQSVQAFVTDARKTGTEVPAAMKPMLERMVEMGQLTDENGNAFSSLEDSGLSFSETMSQGFSRVVESVDKLTRAIANQLGVALDNLPSNVPIDVDVRYRVPELPDGRVPETVSTGGVVRPFGVQHFALGGRVPWTLAPIGTDTIPAMLTPGELILNESQQTKITDLLAAGAAAAQGLLAGARSAPVILQEKFEFAFDIRTIDGTDLAQTVETKLMPQIVSLIEDRRRGYATRLQQALGTS